MPDHPDDPPEFDWLYGGKGQPPPADPADEHTRVIPRSTPPPVPPPAPRPQASQPVPPVVPVQPVTPAQPGKPARRGRGGPGLPSIPRPKPIRWARRALLLAPLLILAWVAYLVAVPVIAVKKIDSVDAFPATGRPADQKGTTYLVVGSDSRAGLTPAQIKKYGAGGGGGQRTDTIMLLHVGAGKPLLMSIPRDSLVPVPGYGRTKINSAFAHGGAKLLVRTIEDATGIRIDDYLEIGFGGLVKAVDAVGGIQICPDKDMKDKNANLNIKKGCQDVDGVTALAYSRSRDAQQYGDLSRAQHQREVVTAIGKKALSPWTVILPWRYSSVINAATSTLTVNKGIGVIALARLARAMTQVTGTSGLTCAIPIQAYSTPILWDRDRALALLKLIKEDRTDSVTPDICTPTGLKIKK